MEAPPPPIIPVSTGQKSWKKEETVVSKSGKVILMLARYTFPFHDWIDENHLKVMIAPIESKAEISGDIKKKYAHIEFVKDYDCSGMVPTNFRVRFLDQT